MKPKGIIKFRVKKDDEEYKPRHISEEARICFTCSLPKYSGVCKHFREEKARLKGLKNGKRI